MLSQSVQKLLVFTLISTLILAFWSFFSEGFAESEPKINRVHNVRFAAHPLYTRVIFDLNKEIKYKIIPNYSEGIVSIIFENSMLSEKLKAKVFSDKRIANIKMFETKNGEARFDIAVTFTKNSFFHIPMENPSRLVFDIKNKTQTAFKGRGMQFARADTKEVPETAAEKQLFKEEKKKIAKDKVKIEEEGKKAEEAANLEKAVKENIEKIEKESAAILAKRDEDGKEDFIKALKLYQEKEKKYPEATKEFAAFIKKYPNSKYRKDAVFLKVDAEYKILTQQVNAPLQPVITFYERALGSYPGSKYEDMALYRMAELYDTMGLKIESKAHFKIIMDKFPGGRYALKAQVRRAQILMDEQDYEFAYKELVKVVKKDPRSSEARDATFEIAKFYFGNKEYSKAAKIFEAAVEKWPSFAQFHPEVIYSIGETYFMLGQAGKAKEQLFKLVNLYPDHELSGKSLNRLGEIYRMAKMNKESAKLFQETVLRNPGSEEADYGLIRIADLGIVDPSMRFNNLIFNYDSFFNPVKTYREVSQKHPGSSLAQMAMLREGITHAKEKSYTAAINKYRELLFKYPDTEIKEDIYALIRETFYGLVDTYYDQKGYMPLLATYHQNLQNILSEIDRPETMFRIGESYLAIGLDGLAATNFEKVKKLDKKGIFREPLLIKSAQIAFARRDFKKAEGEMRKFIKSFPGSKVLKDAMRVLGDSIYRQGNYKKAVAAYTKLLKRFPKATDAPEAYYYLADSYYQQKNYRAALKRFKHSLKIFKLPAGEKEYPSFVGDSYFKIAECYFKTKNYKEAIDTYKKAIEKSPDDLRVPTSQFIMAKSYKALRQGENAMTTLKAIQAKPDGEILNRVASLEIDLIDWEKKYKEYLK